MIKMVLPDAKHRTTILDRTED